MRRITRLPVRLASAHKGRSRVLLLPSFASVTGSRKGFKSSKTQERLGADYDFSHVRCASRSRFSANVRKCEQVLGYVFNKKLLCFEALNFSCQAWLPHPDNPSFYRLLPLSNHLAILGDKILEARMAAAWYRQNVVQYVPQSIGEWERIRCDLPSNANLRKIAIDSGLASLIFTQNGDVLGSGIGEKTAGTTVEALLGAVHIDGGDNHLDTIMDRLGLFKGELLRPVSQEDWEMATLGHLRDLKDRGEEEQSSVGQSDETSSDLKLPNRRVRREAARREAAEKEAAQVTQPGDESLENESSSNTQLVLQQDPASSEPEPAEQQDTEDPKRNIMQRLRSFLSW